MQSAGRRSSRVSLRLVYACAGLALATFAPDRTPEDAVGPIADTASRSIQASASPAETPTLPEGVASEWWTVVQANLLAEAYGVRPDTGGASGSYVADNPGQRWRTRFTSAGVAITPASPLPRDPRHPAHAPRVGNAGAPSPDASMTKSESNADARPAADGWSVGLRLAAYGAGGVLTPVRAVAPQADGARVEFRYDETEAGAPGLTEWYVNDSRGLEHGFTLAVAPAGTGPVTLELAVTGGLRPALQADGRAVELRGRDDAVRLRYADLFAADSTGLTLPATLSVPSDGPARIRLVVDTRGAVFPVTIDPLLTEPPTTFTGAAVGDVFGSSVASAGDVNGDGYADVVVGAPGYASSTGRVYVYHGGPGGLSTTAARILTGEPVSSGFGASVAAAGDVNGDGYADVAILAPWYAAYDGRVYVYMGGPSGLGTTPVARSPVTNDQFLSFVRTAGDVNGDGYSDIVIGAPGYRIDFGAFYLYMGRPDGLSATAMRWSGEATENFFGGSVASPGDVNADGYADLVVGAGGYDRRTGRAYLFLGGASGLASTPSSILTGEVIDSRFGQSVATAGDVNGDGYADVLVGAPEYSSSTGRAYVYLGGASGLATTAAATYTGEATNDSFGSSMATAGDVNRDGYADVVVGAPGYGNSTGRAYVYLGGASGLATTAAAVYTGEATNDSFGSSLATAGDVNGDGYADVVVGARGHSSSTGRAYLYLGGRAVSEDFNRDGTSDILWRHTTGGDVWLWPMDGAAKMSETYVRTVADTNWEIRGQGDVNGDGTADLLWRNEATGMIYCWLMNGATPHGEIYVATVDPAYDIVGTGDFNGDGKSDILWRNATLGDVWIWLMDGAMPLSEVYVDTVDPGYVVKGVGDLDADGKADIVWHGVAGDVWVWLMNGTTRLSQTYVGTVADTTYQIQQVADFDGNGKADLLWWNSVQGDVWIWPMDGATRLSETYVGTVPDTNYRIQAAGDYNGDGKADILWRNIVQGDVWVWLMNGDDEAV